MEIKIFLVVKNTSFFWLKKKHLYLESIIIPLHSPNAVASQNTVKLMYCQETSGFPLQKQSCENKAAVAVIILIDAVAGVVKRM